MVIHFMHYALSAYGWPMFLMTHSKTGMCQLCTNVRCCCFSCCRSNKETTDIIDDNCCHCNYAAMKRMLKMTEAEVIYTTFHVDVGETPFFVVKTINFHLKYLCTLNVFKRLKAIYL